MKLLTAVNLILPKLGEHPVTSLDVRHPTLSVILPEIDNILTQTLLKGWWFNEFKYTALPDTQGNIRLGSTTLSFVPLTSEPAAVLRGLDLYNPDTLSFTWTKGIKGVVTQRVEFDLLPESVAQYVWFSALVNSYVTDLGMAQEVQLWSGQAAAAYRDMLAEHLRQRKYNSRQTRSFSRLRRALRG